MALVLKTVIETKFVSGRKGNQGCNLSKKDFSSIVLVDLQVTDL